MSRDEDIIASAKILMCLGVLGGPYRNCTWFGIAKCAPNLIVKAVALTRYPIIFNGQIVNYANPCGWCTTGNCKMYRLLYVPSLAYYPGCRSLHIVDDGVPPSANGVLLTY